jgi:MFS family permease
MASDESPRTATTGTWTPLTQPTFRGFWLAVVVSNIGTWIHDVAAAWVMAEQTGSAFMVAAVQAATTLPMVLLAILAGTLADIVDRRRFLMLAQLWMVLVASTLALVAHFGMLTPWTLVALTFALGVGAAMAMPAQQATTPELVPRPMLGSAVALVSLGVNVARSIGPALGGLIVAQAGIAWAFGLNALSFVAMLIVLLRWRREPNQSALPPESFGIALRAGLRYATQASTLQAVLVKAALFFFFASALTALLPIVVQRDLQASAGTYGLLLGCIGVGAIGGAMLLPRLRARVGPDRLVLAATLAYAGCMVGLALISSLPALYVVALVNGFAWITVLSALQIAAQTAVPAWVRARALSLYIVVFSAGMAVGSLVWGGLAQRLTSSYALLIAAACAVIASLVSLRFHLGDVASADVMPSSHWPEPMVASEVTVDRGPVMVTVEYQVDRGNRGAFLAAMQVLGQSRRRDGAVQWGVMEDTTAPGTYLEYFLVTSWLEHLRQHERVTGREKQLQETIRSFQIGNAAPRVRHFVGGKPGEPLESAPGDHRD